ncbi:tyrosine--tRNA ligase [Patescibacteria group bacterium]|nr:tyrosine--tRNA ligase [Patescibacteria group bacterium]MBP9709968.1 tyrosine--tRNA ligase [Patescibacteria group bacterium]
MSSVSVDPKQVEWFLTHAVETVYPTREALRERLLSGQKLTVYHGIDPTGPTLHLGHTVPLRKLSELQKLGHKVILLIGDFTAMIGDPTDKAATRKKLTREEVLENCKLYKQQASFLLDFDGPNAAEFRFNSEWLAKMSFADVVELASHFTVQQMMERDMFEKRMEEGKPIHLHEFFYPLMQGYDSVALEVDLEIGGNDQTFNMLAGRTLLKTLKHKEKFVLTNRLLADPTGKKMGKSEGNMLALTDDPKDAYGKVMSWTDEMIVPGFEICTQKTEDDMKEVKAALERGENPIVWKKELARLVVEGIFGEGAATMASEEFVRVHAQGEKPEEIPALSVSGSMALADVLVEAGFVASKTDARRQIEQGGVKVNDEVVTDVKAMVEPTNEGTIIQKGKRHFVKIIQR